MYEDYKIHEEDGAKHLVSKDGCVSVLPDGETKLFTRVAKRLSVGDLSPVSTERMVVAELNGVRAYVLGNRVILSTQEIRL